MPMDPLYEFALSVKAVERQLERATSEAMKPLGITGPQSDAIFMIGLAGPVSLKELGDLLIAEAGHPSRMVDRLVAAGYVARSPAADDRRRVVITLTPKGRELEKKVLEIREDIFSLGRVLVGGRDIDPALALLREFVQYTPYAALIERRRQLMAE